MPLWALGFIALAAAMTGPVLPGHVVLLLEKTS